jgi:hypothetical protein
VSKQLKCCEPWKPIFNTHYEDLEDFSGLDHLLMFSCGWLGRARVVRVGQRSLASERRGRRVFFNIPGSDERKLAKVASLDLDVAVFDLEDGVARSRKQKARDLLREHLTQMGHQYPASMERSIRMNHIGSGLELEDLQSCVLPLLPYLDSILVPKVESPSDLQFVATSISVQAQQKEHPIELIAAIESAKGFLHIEAISAAVLAPGVKLTCLLVRYHNCRSIRSSQRAYSTHLKTFVPTWA